jgi:predicted enzyme related to lactoylglutathione lyase
MEDPMAWSHGKFYWNELMTRDAESAKRFYADTLGWTYDAMPMGEGSTYWVVKMGDEPVGGIFEMTGTGFGELPEGWLAYIAVDDVDRRLAEAVHAGAQIRKPVFDVPGIGRIVILSDPGAAIIGWMTPTS